MSDPDFYGPGEKSPGTYEANEDTGPRPCALAVVSLIFGVLGYFPLLLVGALVAIVTGHVASGEIRDSEGRLGGGGAAKAGLILGYLWFVIALIVVLLVLSFLQVPYRGESATVTSPAPASVPTGVKMANEMSRRDLENFKKLGLGDAPEGEEIICSFVKTDGAGDESDMAVLTTKRIVYLKGERRTSFPLKEIDSIIDGASYNEKYTPFLIDANRYMIEIKQKSGTRMRIAIVPALDGPTFAEALKDAWKSEGGRPDVLMKK